MSKYGICGLSLVPVRNLPSEQSEMVNQLLFGDTVIIDDISDNWQLIRTSHDLYEGWVDKKQIILIDENLYRKYKRNKTYYSSETSTKIVGDNHPILNIVYGSNLPDYNNGKFEIGSQEFQIDDKNVTPLLPNSKENIIRIAMKYLGTPYLWGGRSPYGIDCSGFIQLVFKMAGINLKRDASQQADSGIIIDFIDESKPGDLAFFDNTNEHITHVGIILNNKQILHASGEVRIDSIDHQGIYNELQKKYTHKLRIIKRLL